MADELGPASFGGAEGDALGSAPLASWEPRAYSEATAQRIDTAVQRLIAEAHERARTAIATHRVALDALMTALLREESLDRDQVVAIVHDAETEAQEAQPVANR